MSGQREKNHFLQRLFFLEKLSRVQFFKFIQIRRVAEKIRIRSSLAFQLLAQKSVKRLLAFFFFRSDFQGIVFVKFLKLFGVPRGKRGDGGRRLLRRLFEINAPFFFFYLFKDFKMRENLRREAESLARQNQALEIIRGRNFIFQKTFPLFVQPEKGFVEKFLFQRLCRALDLVEVGVRCLSFFLQIAVEPETPPVKRLVLHTPQNKIFVGGEVQIIRPLNKPLT
ncbi:MAG: hypothetical protein HYZ52_07335 [Candidatus Omnitrophica bacterium]|nr:hypothetical protein [Candidatus Omnitrophota bacterium]